MAVDFKRQDYKETESIWKKCRDVIAGQEKIHSEGSLYLPKLTGQTEVEYSSYVNRSLFYNAAQRTIDAMTGLLFRKPAVYKFPKNLSNVLSNIDKNGNNLNNFAEDVAEEVLTTGRIGLLVDYPKVETNNNKQITRADVEKNNIYPFVIKYKTENVINWSVSTVNNVKVLTQVVLVEHNEVENDFVTSTQKQYRVLKLDQSGFYFQQIWKEIQDTAGKVSLVFSESIYPKKQGQNLNYIPFFIITPKGQEFDIQKPPFLDLINVNLSHYKTSADIEHAAHFTALPTAVVTGHSMQDGETLKIGSSSAWVFSESDAKASYLEYTGQGIDALEKRLEKKEQQMAALGARMLIPDKVLVESAETHTIKRQGENSALSSVSETISDVITKVLKEIVSWEGLSTEEVFYELNKDFVPSRMSPQELTALLQTWLAKGIAFKDFVEQLQKGEIISPDRNAEEIQDDISNEGIITNNE